jgi:hypothetical protein
MPGSGPSSHHRPEQFQSPTAAEQSMCPGCGGRNPQWSEACGFCTRPLAARPRRWRPARWIIASGVLLLTVLATVAATGLFTSASR